MIAFARGNEQGKNAAGEYANPTTDPAGTRKEVMVADTRTGRVTLIGEGEAPLFNSNGDQIIYSREGKLWIAPSIGGKERKLFEIRGNIGAPRMVAGRIAVGVCRKSRRSQFHRRLRFAGGSIRFMSPSVDRDQLAALVR
jgi:hypothetical protein